MEPTIWQVAAVCGFVFLAGFVDSVAGGGGLLSLPAYFAAGLPPHAALATNKFSSACGTLTSVLRYWHAGVIRVRVGLFAAAGAMAGSVGGARLVLLVPAAAVNTVMLVLVPLVTVFLLLRDRLFPAGGGAVQEGKTPRDCRIALAIGAVVGAYDGFFGPGTGTFMALGFAFFLGQGLLNASASARLANLASNVGALVVFLVDGKVLFPLALWAAAASIAGHQAGSRLALRKGARIIKPVMVAVLVLLMAEVVRRRFF